MPWFYNFAAVRLVLCIPVIWYTKAIASSLNMGLIDYLKKLSTSYKNTIPFLSELRTGSVPIHKTINLAHASEARIDLNPNIQNMNHIVKDFANEEDKNRLVDQVKDAILNYDVICDKICCGCCKVYNQFFLTRQNIEKMTFEMQRLAVARDESEKLLKVVIGACWGSSASFA